MADLVETMAYVGEKWGGKVPWHGKGTPVTNDLTPEQMLVKAGLDWEVIKKRCFVEWEGQYIPTDDWQLVRSTDQKMLSIVSENWHVNQNRTAFEFFNEFVMRGNMEMHTAGSLDDGRMVWALAKIDKEFFVANNIDRVVSYLLFSNPHKYGKCIDIRFTPICVVCNNTLTFALNGKEDLQVKLNHTKQFDAELVKKTLHIADEKLENYQSMAQFLAGKRYTKESMVEYFKQVFPKVQNMNRKTKPKEGVDNDLSRPAKTAIEIIDATPHAPVSGDSWWTAFNTVTFAVDHLFGKDDTRLESAWYGQGRARKLNALNKAIEFAKAA